ncbi:MAG: hypothetical protein U1A78_08720 [Polyangia bacterium]
MVDDGTRGPPHGSHGPPGHGPPTHGPTGGSSPGSGRERGDRGDKDRDRREPLPEPDAEPTEDELRAAAALRETLAATELAPGPGGRREPVSDPEARWLAAHLRLPTADDSLGEVRARGLSRAARELLTARREVAARRGGSLRQLGRSLSGTGGLLAAAALLLVVSWALLEQGSRLRQRTMSPTVASALLYRRSLHRAESPSQRLELMLQERLLARRGGAGRSSATVIAQAEPAPPTVPPAPEEARLVALQASLSTGAAAVESAP